MTQQKRDRVGGVIVLTDEERDDLWNTLQTYDPQSGREFGVPPDGKLKYTFISETELPNQRLRTVIVFEGKQYTLTGSKWNDQERIYAKVRKLAGVTL